MSGNQKGSRPTAGRSPRDLRPRPPPIEDGEGASSASSPLTPSGDLSIQASASARGGISINEIAAAARQPSTSTSREQTAKSGTSLTPAGGSGAGRSAARSSIACEACRRRKNKCSGPPSPCTSCRSLGIECIIDETQDNRRKIAVKRAAEVAQTQRLLLQRLLDALRFDGNEVLEQLISRIRGTGTEAEVAQFLERRRRDTTVPGPRKGYPLDELVQEFSDLVSHGSEWRGETEEMEEDARPGKLPRIDPRLEANTGVEQSPDTPSPNTVQMHVSSTLNNYERFLVQLRNQGMPTLDPMETIKPYFLTGDSDFHAGLWRHSTPPPGGTGQGSALSEANLSQLNAQDSRASWHPALRILGRAPSYDGEGPADLSHWVASGIDPFQDKNNRHVHIYGHHAIPGSSIGVDSQLGTNYPRELAELRVPAYAVQSISVYENSPFSRIFTDYRDAARKLVNDGVAPLDVLGHDGVEVELFFRERRPGDLFTVPSWACEVWRSFGDWDVYVRLANVLLLTYLMRWMLLPSTERYDDVPDLIKPSASQRFIPHHIAIDFIPFPPLREALIKNLRDWITVMAAANCSCNWPGELDDAVQRDEETGQLRLTEAFERHVSVAENWSLSSKVLDEFPELEGQIRIEDA